MAKRQSTKVNKNMAALIIGLTVVLAMLLVVMLALRNLPENGENPGSSTAQTTEPTGMDILKQIDGTYEQWLAAGMVMVLPLEYPDFTDLQIYAPGETKLADKQQSAGIYLQFTSGGEQVILHVTPLEAERSQLGTRDLSTMQTGFAAIDTVSGEDPDFASMKQLTLESLSEHIQQVMLPAVYQR